VRRNRISLKNKSELTLKDALELFIKKCRVKNLSSETISTYQRMIKIFLDYADENTKLSEICKIDIENYTLWLYDNPNINTVTINTYLTQLRVFLYYCMDCGYMNPFKVHLIKSEKKIKETYTVDELQRLMEKPDIKTCTFETYRTWVFEAYLVSTGNRISTALNIKIKDIDFQNGCIKLCKTKNRKQQIIPLSSVLSSILQEYLQYRGGEETDYLFCNSYGEQGNIRAFQKAVASYNISRNVNKTSCHLFRHTFAKNWILNGGDIFRLQKILGHSNMNIVREYVNMFSTDLQIDFDKYNPLDSLNTQKGQKITMSRKAVRL